MLFNSLQFLVFLAAVYALYIVLPFKAQNLMLLAASYVFYGWWDTRFLFLVVLSTTVDYWVGLVLANRRLTVQQVALPASFLILSAMTLLNILPRMLGQNATYSRSGSPHIFSGIEIATGLVALLLACSLLYSIQFSLSESKRKKLCLATSVTAQLSLLGFFKYYNFFVGSLVSALAEIGIDATAWHLDIVLPVGISFYTFQSLSYTVDIYRGLMRPTSKYFLFALFVAYFPQLQAGPIERARQLLPQLSNPRSLNLESTTRGLYLIVLGFFKKVGIADGVAVVVDQIYNSSGHVSWADVCIATALFAVEIYCDFSGYTDIARGISKLFGIEMMRNFNLPYFAANPQDFWKRWHISLSTWLRDYLYVPLGGSRGGLAFTCRNLLITMVLGGLWHGAAWNFLLWGAYHGILLCAHRIWHAWRPNGASMFKHPAARLTLVGAFFLVTCYGWLLFRAKSLEQVISFTSILFSRFGELSYSGGMPRFSALLGLAILVPLEIAQYCYNDNKVYQRMAHPAQGLLIALFLTVIAMGMSNEPAQFIYFQF